MSFCESQAWLYVPPIVLREKGLGEGVCGMVWGCWCVGGRVLWRGDWRKEWGPFLPRPSLFRGFCERSETSILKSPIHAKISVSAHVIFLILTPNTSRPLPLIFTADPPINIPSPPPCHLSKERGPYHKGNTIPHSPLRPEIRWL